MMEPRTSTPPVPPGLDLFGRWFEQTFRNFGAAWQVWVLQGLIVLGILLVAGALGAAILFGTLAGFGITNPSMNTRFPTTAAAVLVVESVVLTLALFVVWIYLFAGMITTALKQARGESIAAGDIFSAGWAVVPGLVGLGLLSGLIIAIGYILCIIPGIILTGMLFPAFPIYLDRRLGVIGSMAESFHLTGQNFLLFTLFAFVIYLLVGLINGVFIGEVVGIPLAAIAPVVVYTSLYYTGDTPHPPEAGSY